MSAENEHAPLLSVPPVEVIDEAGGGIARRPVVSSEHAIDEFFAATDMSNETATRMPVVKGSQDYSKLFLICGCLIMWMVIIFGIIFLIVYYS